jgi:FMN reductase
VSVKILAVCGSSRADGRLEQLLAVASAAARSAGAEVRELALCDVQLPLMIWGDPEQGQRDDVRLVRELASWADGFLLSTPEYHGSMSGALKNWFDYLYNELAGKLAGVLASTGGGTGDMSITAVKTSFAWCHGFVLPFHVAASSAAFEQDRLTDSKVIDRAQRIGHDVVRYTPLLRATFEQARKQPGVAAGFAGLHSDES